MSRAEELERRARELAGLRDYGDECRRINEELVTLTPQAIGPRTRLGCCLEAAGDLFGAQRQYEFALRLDPDSSVAKGLLDRLRLRLHFPGIEMPTRVTGSTPAAFRGFPLEEFAELASVKSGDQALERFGPRFDDLARRLNGLSVVSAIQEIRHEPGGLFRSNSLWHQPGHLYTYHFGGRWEAQCNVGFYAPTSMIRRNLVRVGVGFNLTTAGRDPDAARHQPIVIRCFTAVQQALTGSLGRDLRLCLDEPGWAVQFGDEAPDLEQSSDASLARLASARPEATEWFFIGRWLSPNLPADAAALADPKAFLTASDDAFRRLLPLLRAAC